MLIPYLLAKYVDRYTARLLRTPTAADNSGGAPQIPRADILYVHVPFCRELCPFCSFHRVKYSEDVAQSYFNMLRVELGCYAERGFSFTTIYVGGGTPTVLPERLEEVLAHARALWPLREVSVETTPGDLSPENIEMLQRAGVNRLSVGVQSFQNDLLATVNRLDKYGSGAETRKRLRQVVGAFDTVNVDLIFGLEGQTRDQLTADLEIAKDSEADQITCYPLMVSDGTMPRYSEWKANAVVERDWFGDIRRTLEPEYTASTAWCFSKGDAMIDEYVVEHLSYAGAGSGAFGFLDGELVANVFSVDRYIETVGSRQSPIDFRRQFSRGEYLRYFLLTQVMRGEISLPDLHSHFPWPQLVPLYILFGLLTLAGRLVWKREKIVIRSWDPYWDLVLTKSFFQGVGKLRKRCAEIVDENAQRTGAGVT